MPALVLGWEGGNSRGIWDSADVSVSEQGDGGWRKAELDCCRQWQIEDGGAGLVKGGA